MKKQQVIDRIQMKFGSKQLDMIICALLQNSYNKKFVSNVNQLFMLFSPQSYTDDFGKETRVYMIKTIVQIILENKIDDKDTLLGLLSFDGKYCDDANEILSGLVETNITEAERSYIDNTVSNQLKYRALSEQGTKIIDRLTDFQNNNYDDMNSAISTIEDAIGNINKDLKAARESIEDAKDLNLSSNNFIGVLDEIIQEERNPSSKVKTGLQYMNCLLGGGFEKGRLYLACGMAKGGKSAFLLQSAIWAKQYNTFTTKDPNRKPVIVYLSMENTNKETIQRIWNYCFGDDSEMKNYNKNDAAAMLEKAGIFTPNNPELPELQLWYRSNRSINANDIAAMLDDLEKNDKECVFLIVDYLARMKAVEYNKEQRLELSNITNDLKTLAADYDIPILSAHQLNREAFKTFEVAENFEEKIKASNSLGVSQIGDSIDVVRNCDEAFIVNRIQKRSADENGDYTIVDRYLFVKLIASRRKMPSITAFQHRFKDGNGMALLDDINASHPYSTRTDLELAKEQLEKNGQKTRGGRSILG